MTQRETAEMGPLVNNNEPDQPTRSANCLVMLYNAPVRTAEEAEDLHTVSLDRNDWKCVRAVREDVTLRRPGHMPQGSAAGEKLLTMRKITVVETGPAWDGLQYYVPDALVFDVNSSWADFEGHMMREFSAESGELLAAPRACWCAWPADRVFAANGKVALSPGDVEAVVSPLKDQGGLFMRRSGAAVGQKRAAGGAADEVQRRLQFSKESRREDEQEQVQASGSRIRSSVDLEPRMIKVRFLCCVCCRRCEYRSDQWWCD